MARLIISCFLMTVFLHGTCNRVGAQFTTVLNIPPDPNIGDYFDCNLGCQLNLSGGGSIGANSRFFGGSQANIIGGTIGNRFSGFTGSEINFFGNDFRIDGALVPGLQNAGDTLPLNVPAGVVLSGIFADGTTFVFSDKHSDLFFDGTLTLHAAALAPVGPATINAAIDPIPQGVREGQSITVGPGSRILQDFRLGRGSILNVTGGSVGSVNHVIGSRLRAVGAEINLLSGEIGRDFSVHDGSVVNIEGGFIDTFFLANNHSVVNMSGGSVAGGRATGQSIINLSGGTLGEFSNRFIVEEGSTLNISGGTNGVDGEANAGSTVNVTGGALGFRFDANAGSTINISGGEVHSQFTAHAGSLVNVTGGVLGVDFGNAAMVNISGGTIGDRFFASSDSEVNLFGKQFFLDGVDLASFLIPGQPFVISDRDVPLIGVLADGTPFDFLLARSGGRTPATDVFQTGSTLTVTLVIPEPASFLLIMMSLAGLSLRSSRLPASEGRKSPA